jgi:hypothetical protein
VLYVTELGHRSGGLLTGYGSIVRIEPGGAQSVFAADTAMFYGPFDVGITPDGYLWSCSTGLSAGRRGWFVRTRITDGASEALGGRAFGVAVEDDGKVYVATAARWDRLLRGDRVRLSRPDTGSFFGVTGALAIVRISDCANAARGERSKVLYR